MTRAANVSVVSLILCFLAAIFIAPAPAHAMDPIVEMGSSSRGVNNALGFNVSVAAYGSGKFVKWKNFINGNNHGEIDLKSEVLEVICCGAKTYVITKDGKFHSIDSSDVDNPSVTGTTMVAVVNGVGDAKKNSAKTRVVVTDGAGTATTVDIEDDDNPQVTNSQSSIGLQIEMNASTAFSYLSGDLLLRYSIGVDDSWTPNGSLSIPAGVTDMSFNGDYSRLYVGNASGITSVATSSFTIAGTYNSANAIYGVDMTSSTTEGIAYEWDGFSNQRYLRYVDVQNDNSINVLASYQFSSTKGLFGDLTRDPSNPKRVGVAHETGWEAFEEDMGNLNKIQDVKTGHLYQKAVVISFLSYLMVAAQYSGVEFYTIFGSAPNFLAYIVWEYAVRCIRMFELLTVADAPPGSSNAGTYAIVALSELGMSVVDIINPAQPQEVGGLFWGGGPANDIAVVGDYALFTDFVSVTTIGLSDPANPSLDNTLNMTGADRIVATSTHAYVTSTSNDVQIVDVTNLPTPTAVGSVPATAFATAIATDGNYLLISTAPPPFGDTVLGIYDLANPISPSLLGTWQPGSGVGINGITLTSDGSALGATSSAAASAFAHLALGDAGYTVLDITNPASPQFVDNAPTDGEAVDVVVDQGNNVWVSDNRTGIMQFAFTPPVTPIYIQAFDARFQGAGVDLSWDIAADEAVGGFRILRGRPGEVPGIIHPQNMLGASTRSYHDGGAGSGDFEYTLVAVTATGDEFRSQKVTVKIPDKGTVLHPISPNPFNPSTTMSFEINQAGLVNLSIYNARGALVITLVNETLPAGSKEIAWDGRDTAGNTVASGIYIARLQRGREVLTRKAVLVK